MRHESSSGAVIMTTPRGHAVSFEMDEDEFAVRHAKVVNHYTGIAKELDEELRKSLANAMRAKRVYEQSLDEVRNLERTLQGFGALAAELGNDHPALEPYVKEAERHKTVARDMFLQARHFHDDAMIAIDKIAETK